VARRKAQTANAEAKRGRVAWNRVVATAAGPATNAYLVIGPG